MSPKCQGADVILFWLNCTKNYEEKRKGQEWAPPPSAIVLIRSIKFLCLIDYQDWDSNFSCPLEFEMIFTLEVHGLQFFILSLVNNASYLQTFVFGLMLMHS